MRFKDYLLESVEASLEGFTRHLSTVANRNYTLWRGVDARFKNKIGLIKVDVDGVIYDISVYKFNARTERRNSQSGDDALMNIASTWKGFPRRAFSAFATQDVHHADQFGEPGLVIPADNVEVFGYVPHDFNYPTYGSAEYKALREFEEVTDQLNYFMSCVHDLVMDGEGSKADEMRKEILKIAVDVDAKHVLSTSISELQYNVASEKMLDATYRFTDAMIKKYKKLKEMNDTYAVLMSLDRLLEEIESAGHGTMKSFIEDVTPQRFGAKLHTFESLPNNEGSANEVWFEGDYLVLVRDGFARLPHPRISKILKAIKEQHT